MADSEDTSRSAADASIREAARGSHTATDVKAECAAEAGPSLASALDQLVAGSQGFVGKRLDLALLDAKELLAHSIERAALVGVGMLLAAATWIAGAATLVQVLLPEADPAVRLASFTVFNAAGMAGFAVLATRQSGPAPRNDQGIRKSGAAGAPEALQGGN